MVGFKARNVPLSSGPSCGATSALKETGAVLQLFKRDRRHGCFTLTGVQTGKGDDDDDDVPVVLIKVYGELCCVYNGWQHACHLLFR